MIRQLTENEDESFIIPVYSSQHAIEWSAVLESQSIPFEIKENIEDNSCFFILEKEHYDRAVENIKAYESERPFFEKFRKLFSSKPTPLRFKSAFPVLIFAIVISFFYFVSGPVESNSRWQLRGMLSSKFFSDSFWWTPVTAITLHADLSHLLGNMLFFLVFGTAAAIQTGAGTAMFFIVISGILANLSTLTVFGDKIYNALGFSTSVFGVLGILTTVRLMKNIRKEKIFSFYFWMPLISAIAIMGLTGGAAGSDIAGHSFGFFWGCILGIAVHFLAEFKRNIYLQIFLYFVTLAIISFSWHEALK